MTIMTKEKDNPAHSFGSNDVSDEELVRMWNDIKERIKSRTPDCPLEDGETGKFVEFIGPRGDALYRCSNGHEFVVWKNLVEVRKGDY
jgi:hypothetical protein